MKHCTFVGLVKSFTSPASNQTNEISSYKIKEIYMNISFIKLQCRININ